MKMQMTFHWASTGPVLLLIQQQLGQMMQMGM
jgi:hypothetical protein